MCEQAQDSAGEGPRPWSRAWAALAIVSTTFLFLAEPLLGLGSLLPTDILETAAPWSAEREVGSTPENTTLSDTVDLHVHFASIAEDVRAGEASWWDRALSGGIPVLKAGFSPVLWVYLLVPAWYAPGAAAAIRTLIAAGLTYGFLRSLEVERAPAAVAGVAYALSGFMVGWAGWPQANVAAFVPGLFWCAELLVRRPNRRVVGAAALCIAAMIVSNFPLVTAYSLLAAGAYAVWRLVSTRLDEPRVRVTDLARPAILGIVGVALGAVIAAVHIVSFFEFHDWGDTDARAHSGGDSSIGGRYLLTLVLPRAWGSHHTGHGFWGEGTNWVEAQGYAGVAVVVLAVLALAAGRPSHGASGPIADRGSAARALWAVAILGAWIAYVGGPLTELVQSLPYLGQNAVGRSRVVVNLAVAALAGLGLQAWIDARRRAAGVDIRRAARTGLVGAAVVVAVTAPWWLDWIGDARDRGLVGETAGAAVVPLLAGVVLVAALAGARRTARVAWVPPVVLGIVAFELLFFAWPVATVVDASAADPAEPAHEFLVAALGPGERLAGEGRTFFPNTGQLTEVDDARGHLITSAEWRALVLAVDPAAFGPPGTVTNPSLRHDVDLAAPALDRMAVRYWAAEPHSAVRGTATEPPSPGGSVPLGATPVATDLVVPEGGLRAVSLVVTELSGAVGRLTVAVDGEGGPVTGWRRLDELTPGSVVTVPLAGESLPVGETVSVEVGVSVVSEVRVGTVDGELALGTVAGADDGLTLEYADGVVLYRRASAPVAWLAHAARVASDGAVATGPIEGAALVEAGGAPGLPDTAPTGATGSVTVTGAVGDEVVLEVETSHPGLVVVSQVVYPGWEATVDGAPVDVFTADGAFPAVAVGEGAHVVRLRYRPSSIAATGTLSAVAAVAALGLWLVPVRGPEGVRSTRRRSRTTARAVVRDSVQRR